MKAPLGRTARIWALTLFLGGGSLLTAIAWFGFGHARPQLRDVQPAETSESLVERTTPPMVPAKAQPEPKAVPPSVRVVHKSDFQAYASPVPAEPQPAPAPPPPEVDLPTGPPVSIRRGIFGGLNKVVGWVAAMRDAGTAGTK